MFGRTFEAMVPRLAPSMLAFAVACSCSGEDDKGDETSREGETSDETDASVPSDDGADELVRRLRELTSTCEVASSGSFASDDGEVEEINICGLQGAYFWKADMDIDCDGQSTPECNESTDGSYWNETSFTQSDGNPLVASELPFVVIPLPSERFDYTEAGIEPGAACIVIYKGKMSFGVFGDEGPEEIIGEASYAMAKSLGVDPDPSYGGTDSGVTYIVFTGKTAAVRPIEDHVAAVETGQVLAEKLLAENS